MSKTFGLMIELDYLNKLQQQLGNRK